MDIYLAVFASWWDCPNNPPVNKDLLQGEIKDLQNAYYIVSTNESHGNIFYVTVLQKYVEQSLWKSQFNVQANLQWTAAVGPLLLLQQLPLVLFHQDTITILQA